MRASRLTVLAVLVVIVAGLSFTLAVSPNAGILHRPPTDRSVLARSPQQQGNVMMPYPTEVDPLAERRDDAGAFADEAPELKTHSEVIPAITDYLEDDDVIVRLYGANAVRRIAMSAEADHSGLRVAVRDNQALQDALFDTLTYGYSQGPDGDDMRRDAASAILYLYYDATGPVVEQAMTSQYWDEVADEVRLILVQTLCEHGYTSQSTRDVFDDATGAYDTNLAATAQRCLDALP